MTLLTQWNPFREMTSLQGRMNRLFDDSVSGLFGNTGAAARTGQTDRNWFSPLADIQEDENHLYLDFELPGISEKDVKITLQNNVLTVEGERRAERKSEKGNWLHQESYYGTFSRSFTLPGTADADSVQATFNNGLLQIRIEKRAEAKPKQIQIGINQKTIKGQAA
jgi:HSP20 family protein